MRGFLNLYDVNEKEYRNCSQGRGIHSCLAHQFEQSRSICLNHFVQAEFYSCQFLESEFSLLQEESHIPPFVSCLLSEYYELLFAGTTIAYTRCSYNFRHQLKTQNSAGDSIL